VPGVGDLVGVADGGSTVGARVGLLVAPVGLSVGDHVSSPVGPTVGDNVDLVGTVVGDFVVGDLEGASVGGG
jgi:hypothetical protein